MFDKLANSIAACFGCCFRGVEEHHAARSANRARDKRHQDWIESAKRMEAQNRSKSLSTTHKKKGRLAGRNYRGALH